MASQIGDRNFWLRTAAVLVAVVTISACAAKPKNDPLAGGGGLKGNWASADGVFTAELSDGRFVSRANDTGEVLSQGSYVVSSVDAITLNWRSQARNEDSSANCTRQGVEVLNCTDQAGRTFTLRKVST